MGWVLALLADKVSIWLVKHEGDTCFVAFAVAASLLLVVGSNGSSRAHLHLLQPCSGPPFPVQADQVCPFLQQHQGDVPRACQRQVAFPSLDQPVRREFDLDL